MKAYRASNNLRFIMRDGKRILQQEWQEIYERSTIWRDVPLVENESNEEEAD